MLTILVKIPKRHESDHSTECRSFSVPKRWPVISHTATKIWSQHYHTLLEYTHLGCDPNPSALKGIKQHALTHCHHSHVCFILHTPCCVLLCSPFFMINALGCLIIMNHLFARFPGGIYEDIHISSLYIHYRS